ncbi:MAG: chromate transporter [Romboutsia sp.]|uniref:chromate transporter n=1 Tax=Romboutsia sp. TaxID=1965302 RepID=UPI003F321A68
MIILKLFFSFLKVGLFSVGGGYAAIPLIQDQIVNVHSLMTLEEFSDLITIAEMTPGPISINASTFVGTRVAGPWGAIICTLACIIPSFIICLTLAYFYYKYRDLNGVQTVLSALRPAVVALIASAGASILMLGLFQADISSFNLSDFKVIEFILFGACLYIIRKYKASAVSIIFGSGVVGTLMYLSTGFTL